MNVVWRKEKMKIVNKTKFIISILMILFILSGMLFLVKGIVLRIENPNPININEVSCYDLFQNEIIGQVCKENEYLGTKELLLGSLLLIFVVGLYFLHEGENLLEDRYTNFFGMVK